VRRGARAGSGLLAAALLAGCGGGAPKVAQPVVNEHALRPTPLIGTTWSLIGATQQTGTLIARPNVDVTLQVQPDGHYLLHSCNNVFGVATTTGPRATFDGGSDTWRHCPGLADQVDQLVAAVLPGHVEWAIDGSTLTVTNPATRIALEFRVRDGAPPLDAAPVVTVVDGAVRCRLVAGHTADGDRLYALARTRPNGPWRLLPSGPAAPGDGPLLAPQLTDSEADRACVAGFAPPGTATMRFRAPGRTPQDVPLHHATAIADAIYVGVLPSAATGGQLIAYDAAGHELGRWATTP
jgi:heat shock protein HslJ